MATEISLVQRDIPVMAAQHALQMRRLVGDEEQPIVAPNACKEIMLAALAAAEIDLLLSFGLVPPDEVDSRPVCGTWTLTQLAGHLADWDSLFLYWLSLLLGNLPRDIVWDEDGNTLNHIFQMQREGQSWQSAWQEMRLYRSRLQGALALVAPDEFMRVQAPNEEVPFPTIYHCAWSALEHYLDHAAGLRRELEMVLPQEMLQFHGPYT